MALDELDKSILAILYEDSRTPFTKIADIITEKFRKKGYIGPKERIPDTTIHFRVKKLKDNNIINKFTIFVSPKTLGYTITALVSINVGGHILKEISVKRTQEIAERMAKNELIRFIGLGEDKTSIYLIVVSKNEEELENLLNTLRKDPDISKIDVSKFTEVVKGEETLTPIQL
ncbi:MAG: Lrp/AsnC family transcriptional regulator [Candidatus Odinarchaeia archaeon]